VQGAEKLMNVLAESLTSKEGFPKTVLLSLSSLTMPQIEFFSPIYQERLRGLQTYGEKSERKESWLKKQLLPVVVEATTGASKPEDFMFMSFILGLYDLWNEAIEVAEQGLTISGDLKKSEAYYYIAFAKRRVATLVDAPSKQRE